MVALIPRRKSATHGSANASYTSFCELSWSKRASSVQVIGSRFAECMSGTESVLPRTFQGAGSAPGSSGRKRPITRTLSLGTVAGAFGAIELAGQPDVAAAQDVEFTSGLDAQRDLVGKGLNFRLWMQLLGAAKLLGMS
jgi:hypothetical protein